MKVYTANNNTQAFEVGGKILTSPASDGPVGPSYDLLLESAEGNFTKDGSNFISVWSDTSGNSNNATQIGATSLQPTWMSNVDGSPAVYFDGDDYMTIANNAAFDFGAGDFTMEYDLKVTNPATANAMPFAKLNNTNSLLISFYSQVQSNILYFGFYDGTTFYNLTSSYTSTNFVNIAATRNGNVFKLFLDGVQVDTFTQAITIQTTATDISIGNRLGSINRPLTGYIKNIKTLKGTALYT